MGVLEEIMQLKSQGINNEEIVRTLQEKGVSPKQINDALNQAQIKTAISDSQDVEQEIPEQSLGGYAPKTQEIPEQEMYAPQAEQNYSSGQEFYPQENYESQPSYGEDTNTLIEISEQVFSEKIKKIKKQTEEINEFKTLAQAKIEDNSNRLRRIETTMDKLQIAILGKISSYGDNLENIKKEMSMMQDSFGKMINPLVEKAEKKHSVSKTHQKVPKSKKSTKRK